MMRRKTSKRGESEKAAGKRRRAIGWRSMDRSVRACAVRVGQRYQWQSADPAAVPIIIGLDRECTVRQDRTGERLVFYKGLAYGFSLHEACALGWCWEVQSAGRQHQVLEVVVDGTHGYACPKAVGAPESERIRLADGVRFEVQPTGELRFSRGLRRPGLTLREALAARWCEPAPDRAERAVVGEASVSQARTGTPPTGA